MQEDYMVAERRAFARWLKEEKWPLIWAAREEGYTTDQAIELLKLWALEGIEGNMPD